MPQHTTPHCMNRLFEWCSSVILVHCGALAVTAHLLGAAPQLAFTAFANLGLSQVATGILFLVTGGARCIALWRNGHWPNGPMVRAFCALVGAAIWSQLLYGILEVWFTQHLLYLSISVWSSLLVFEGMSFYRAMLDSSNKTPAILGNGNEP